MHVSSPTPFSRCMDSESSQVNKRCSVLDQERKPELLFLHKAKSVQFISAGGCQAKLSLLGSMVS